MSNFSTPGAINPAGLGLAASVAELDRIVGLTSAVQTQLNTKPTVVGVPASAAAAGVAGTISFDATSIYYCVSTGVWVKATLATWP